MAANRHAALRWSSRKKNSPLVIAWVSLCLQLCVCVPDVVSSDAHPGHREERRLHMHTGYVNLERFRFQNADDSRRRAVSEPKTKAGQLQQFIVRVSSGSSSNVGDSIKSLAEVSDHMGTYFHDSVSLGAITDML